MENTIDMLTITIHVAVISWYLTERWTLMNAPERSEFWIFIMVRYSRLQKCSQKMFICLGKKFWSQNRFTAYFPQGATE